MKQKKKSNKNIEERIAEILKLIKNDYNPLRVPDLEITENEFIEKLINSKKEIGFKIKNKK